MQQMTFALAQVALRQTFQKEAHWQTPPGKTRCEHGNISDHRIHDNPF
jgi:hypothetical protein